MQPTSAFLDVIMTRRSIRDFQSGEVPQEDIERILQAAVMAPSPNNSQPWRFHVLRGKTKEKYVQVLKNTSAIPPQWHQILVGGMTTVPVILAVENTVPLDKQDIFALGSLSLLGTAASAENILLAVHALGYGGVWLGFAPVRDAVKQVVDISGEVMSVIPVGHPGDHQNEYFDRTRNPLEEVVKFYD